MFAVDRIAPSDILLRKCTKMMRWGCEISDIHVSARRNMNTYTLLQWTNMNEEWMKAKMRMPTTSSLHCWTLNNWMEWPKWIWRSVKLKMLHIGAVCTVHSTQCGWMMEKWKRGKNESIMNEHFNRKWNERVSRSATQQTCWVIAKLTNWRFKRNKKSRAARRMRSCLRRRRQRWKITHRKNGVSAWRPDDETCAWWILWQRKYNAFAVKWARGVFLAALKWRHFSGLKSIECMWLAIAEGEEEAAENTRLAKPAIITIWYLLV